VLSRFTIAVTGGTLKKSDILIAAAGFLLPFAVLLVVALLFSEDLLWAALGISAFLVIFAIIRFLK